MSIGNEPAYSTTDSHDFKGLTKRELFAAMAMQAMIEAEYAKTLDKFIWAADSVSCADALLAQLSKDQQP